MNNKLMILLCGVAIGGVGGWAIFHASPIPLEKRGDPDVPSAETKDGTPGITLTPAQIEKTGLKTESPHAVKLPRERVGYAQVLDPSALLSGFADIALAQANSAASEKERVRLKDLHENGDNASGQAVDAATLAAERDRIQLSTTVTKLQTTWGTLAATDEIRNRFASKMSAGGSLLRIDFATNEILAAEGKKVSLYSLGRGDAVVPAVELVGPARSVDAQFQGQSFWAILSDRALPIGASFEARLILGENEKDALTVPESALLRNEGRLFVYVQASPEKFARKRVQILQKVSDGEAISGIAASDQIVTTGAQQLLSAELGGEGSED